MASCKQSPAQLKIAAQSPVASSADADSKCCSIFLLEEPLLPDVALLLRLLARLVFLAPHFLLLLGWLRVFALISLGRRLSSRCRLLLILLLMLLLLLLLLLRQCLEEGHDTSHCICKAIQEKNTWSPASGCSVCW